MLDKNYKIEKGFLAEIPVRFRAGATSMLAIEPLFKILAWEPGLVARYFGEKPPLAEDRILVISRLVLSKITYFNPRTLDAVSMQKLVQLAAQTLELPHANAEKIAQLTLQNYPVFSAWMSAVVKQVKQPRALSKLVVKDSPDADVNWCR